MSDIQGVPPALPPGLSAPVPLLRPAAQGPGRLGRRRIVHAESPRTRARRIGSTRLGMGLVELPPVPVGDPAEAVLAVAEVPEDRRFCSHCNRPVGRARNQRPARTEGFCPNCRNHYSFTPKLQPQDLVMGQYRVAGALAYGSTGWVYLARDTTYDRWVVLKGLPVVLGDQAAAVVARYRFLADLDHRNLVQVYDFVVHDNRPYAVMEYVGGKSLRTILRERRQANEGRPAPLPVDQAIACVLGILPALGYLHDDDLVYCDLKPDNIVLAGDSLKLIDLGGVRRIDDYEAAIFGTMGYQAPEVAQLGPSVASDIYTVGRTLAVLILDVLGFQNRYVDSLPPPDQQPLLAERETLHRLLLKATAPDPADRFGSAEELAEQLVGILREEAALRGEPRPVASPIFGPDDLGHGPVEPERYEAPPDWRQLPRPKVDPADPGASFLVGLAEGDPVKIVATMMGAWADKSLPVTTETLLRLARAHLEAGSVVEASATLDSLGDVRDWRLWWHRGLVALARGAAFEAVGWLDPVYTDLPGEVVPKLALAVAHELAGSLARSAELYDRVCRIDPSYVSGAFGLARVRLAMGDRGGAVEALERVPLASPAYEGSRVAALRALVARTDAVSGAPSLPTPEQLERAGAILEQLDLEPGRRARLELEFYEAGMAVLDAGSSELAESGLRRGMEQAYRQLARHAATRRERTDLVDQANRVRPLTLL